uniref:Uncharacterized protein n=1 Tax=Kalanchoe fedtschenkoi TaxID=63787 RepID=A0A7N0UTM3_KALFE
MRILPKKWTRSRFLGAASTARASSNTIVIRHSDASNVNLIGSAMNEDFVGEEKDGGAAVHKAAWCAPSSAGAEKKVTAEEAAAVKIQAAFRGRLARRAFGALRSLVKLQAVVRGASVRRQSRLAFHCMHAMVRLQVRVRARQLIQRVN